VLHAVGMTISAGELSDLLIKDQELFHAESAALVRAGLASSPWQHLDSTGTRLNGQNQQCHILCNPLYTAYCTTACKDRLSLLRVLLGGTAPDFRCTELALSLMGTFGVTSAWVSKLAALLPQEQVYTETQIDQMLDEHLPKLGVTARKQMKDALAIAAYRTQTIFPVVDLLICDDAPQFNGLTEHLALCWIHEYRHYKKLQPRFLAHCQMPCDLREELLAVVPPVADLGAASTRG
jgi:hypothetical protein